MVVPLSPNMSDDSDSEDEFFPFEENADLPNKEEVRALWLAKLNELREKDLVCSLKMARKLILASVELGPHPDCLAIGNRYRYDLPWAEKWQEDFKDLCQKTCITLEEIQVLGRREQRMGFRLKGSRQLRAIAIKSVEWYEYMHDVTRKPYYMYQLVDVVNKGLALRPPLRRWFACQDEQKTAEGWLKEAKQVFFNTPNKKNTLMQSLTPKVYQPVFFSTGPRTVKEGLDHTYEIAAKLELRNAVEQRRINQVSLSSSLRPTPVCTCSKPAFSLMIRCEVCYNWYHHKCVGEMLAKFFVCILCQWTKRPTIVEAIRLLGRYKTLGVKVLMHEVEALEALIERAQACDRELRFFFENPSIKDLIQKILDFRASRTGVDTRLMNRTAHFQLLNELMDMMESQHAFNELKVRLEDLFLKANLLEVALPHVDKLWMLVEALRNPDTEPCMKQFGPIMSDNPTLFPRAHSGKRSGKSKQKGSDFSGGDSSRSELNVATSRTNKGGRKSKVTKKASTEVAPGRKNKVGRKSKVTKKASTELAPDRTNKGGRQSKVTKKASTEVAPDTTTTTRRGREVEVTNGASTEVAPGITTRRASKLMMTKSASTEEAPSSTIIRGRESEVTNGTSTEAAPGITTRRENELNWTKGESTKVASGSTNKRGSEVKLKKGATTEVASGSTTTTKKRGRPRKVKSATSELETTELTGYVEFDPPEKCSSVDCIEPSGSTTGVLTWVLCDECTMWFHIACVTSPGDGVEVAEEVVVEDEDIFVCVGCRKEYLAREGLEDWTPELSM